MSGLFIKDEKVNALAKQLQRATKAKTKTEAVKIAIENALSDAQGTGPMRKKIQQAKAKVRKMGDYVDPDFDQKAYSDEMWGD